MKCPICGGEYPRLLALSRRDNVTMICDSCGVAEALEDFGKELGELRARAKTPQERTRDRVMATGNKWAIQNFNETHS